MMANRTFFILLLILAQPVVAQVVLKQTAEISGHYLVTFESNANKKNLGERLRKEKSLAFRALQQNQKNNIERLKSDLNSTDLVIKRDLWLTQTVAISISSQHISNLKSLSYVTSVRSDKQYKVELLGAINLPLSGELVQDNLEHIGIDALWNAGYRGQGVVVAILDSGVDYLHVELADRWRGGVNSWFDPFGQMDVPDDLSGHGTSVSSIVLAGNDRGSTASYLGVAPNAQWIAARVFDNDDNSSESAIREALQWVVNPDGDVLTDDYPDIVQNSWGLAATEGGCTPEFRDELEAINSLGIDIVFAAGNSGFAGPSSYLTPAWNEHVISVGAINHVDEIFLSDSSRGPDLCGSSIIPSLVAPGENILTATSTFGGFSPTNTFGGNDGTSFSAPHVSGALALLRSFFKSQNNIDYRDAIFNSASDLGTQGDDDFYGRGKLQVNEALILLQDDATPLRENEIQFSNAVYEFSESVTKNASAVPSTGVLPARISILRTGDLSVAASVTLTSVDSSANNGSDYQVINEVVDFASGDAIKLIVIQLINDNEIESDEFFNLQLSEPTNVTLGAKSELKITIKDEDKKQSDEDASGGGSGGILLLLILSLIWVGKQEFA